MLLPGLENVKKALPLIKFTVDADTAALFMYVPTAVPGVAIVTA